MNKIPELTEEKKLQLLEQFRIKNSEDFKGVLFKWTEDFCRKYLTLNPTPFQDYIFMIKWPKEMDSMLDPDIGGSMAESIIKASEKL